MRKEETVFIAEKEITVRELTVAQVDKVLSDFDQNRPVTKAEILINSVVPIEVVSASTGLTKEELNGDLTPSELNVIWEAVARVNDFLSGALLRTRDEIRESALTMRGTPFEGSLPT